MPIDTSTLPRLAIVHNAPEPYEGEFTQHCFTLSPDGVDNDVHIPVRKLIGVINGDVVEYDGELYLADNSAYRNSPWCDCLFETAVAVMLEKAERLFAHSDSPQAEWQLLVVEYALKQQMEAVSMGILLRSQKRRLTIDELLGVPSAR